MPALAREQSQNKMINTVLPRLRYSYIAPSRTPASQCWGLYWRRVSIDCGSLGLAWTKSYDQQRPVAILYDGV
ncbi:hypothetical protein Micbo1qcDRAFT_164840 [Microdochium bolleyi]|uniref:Uncharacterized protein n=1 Tax=Microdochium bolleyi TaxID=196109 RepID=A0A136IZG6_9PEZI|nr:hypothetical protein Micbo1qcDRAFT_164840 [Microdochium bolleyi]